MSNLVTFDQAKMLKELGFNEKVCDFYMNEDLGDSEKLINFNGSGCSNVFSAPKCSDALDWVREDKGIACSVNFVFKYNDTTDNVDVQYFGQVLQSFPQFIDQVTEEFDTHPLANSALLTAVLNYLKEKENK